MACSCPLVPQYGCGGGGLPDDFCYYKWVCPNNCTGGGGIQCGIGEYACQDEFLEPSCCKTGTGGGGTCTGTAGGPCTGTCSNGQSCRAAIPQNGGACGCHASGGGGCDSVSYSCSKNCNPANRGSSCGTANTPPYETKYNCRNCCRVTNPTAPALSAPANNSTVSTATVTLRWQQPASWGSDCGSNTPKTFKVYYGLTAATQFLIGTFPGTTTSTNFNAQVGQTYYWKVVAQNNQAYNNSESATWKFTIAPVTVKVKAVEISPLDTSCAAIATSTTGINGAIHKFTPGSPSNPPPKTQSGNTPVQFNALPGGTYTLSPIVPTIYTLKRACWSKTGAAPWTAGLSAPAGGGDTVTWNLGYTSGEPWAQVSGGDVYANTDLTSLVAGSAVPRKFIIDGLGGSPGLATYGETYVFDGGAVDKGKTLVSSTNWLAQDVFPLVDYYALFYRRFGGTPLTIDYASPSAAIAQPASRATPYYVTGDMTTSGDWTVGNGENVIFFVDGDLTIAGNINITGTGFVAFIVNGNISIDPDVGVPYTSSAPVVEGVYITGSKGVFRTGDSTSVGHERFVGRGMFIAGSFSPRRDLDPLGTNGQNNTTAAELFIYNPRLLMTMPDKMRESPISWQEVAP